jgi:hypothetical protein
VKYLEKSSDKDVKHLREVMNLKVDGVRRDCLTVVMGKYND